jgi:hypothetical protein
MSNKIIFVITSYSIGVVCGILCTKKYFKDKYYNIAQEEIASIKEVQSRKHSSEAVENTSSQEVKHEEPHATSENKNDKYNKMLQKMGYIPKDTDAPYVIAPHEFMTKDGYDGITLTYYSDGVLADENDEVLEDVEDIIGIDSLHCFGEYEEDSVYVRNDEKLCDYEILLDNRNYSDVYNERPH